MKRLLSFLAMLLSSVAALAQVFEVDGIKYNITSTDDLTVEVARGGEYSGEIVISAFVQYEGKTYSVTSIEYGAFYGCSGLTSITIPNSVTSIGDAAFILCSGLTSITIPNSVTSIGGDAFALCSGLTSITIPNSVTSIGNFAFYHTAWLDNQSDGVVYAGKVAYCYKGDMPENTSIILDEGTTGIAYHAFSGCKGLTSITIPNSVTSIGGWAFSDCGSLTSIVVETGNTVYDSREGCNAIIKTDDNELVVGCKNTVIPNSVTSIGSSAFEDCSGLTSINIPNSVTSIGGSAFKNCSGLTSVTVQRGTPVAINNDVFSNRTNANLYVPTGCVAVYQAADYWKEFGRIEELFTGTLTDEQGVKYTANADGATCTVSGHEEGYDTSIIIPKVFQGRTVSSISDNAFKGCSNLTSVNIPSSVTSIGNNAFDACVNLTNVGVCIDSPIEIDNSVFSNKANATLYVPANSVAAYQTADNWKEFSVIEAFFTGTMTDEQGVRYTANNDGTWTVSGHDYNNNASIAIPKVFRCNSVTSIGRAAFSHCSGLTSITIPNSVTSIGNYAFQYCSGLTSITIPNSVTSIGEEVFWGCSSLTSITIPNSVTSIGDYAFEDCSGLTSITIPNSVTSIGEEAFRGCSSLTSIVVEAGNAVYDSREGCNAIIKTRDNELIAGCKNTIIPSSVTSIGHRAFFRCSGLTSITIPNSVTSIGGLVFSDCGSLTSIVVEAGNTVYDSREDCNAIIKTSDNELIAGCKNTIIPNSVTSIGEFALYFCSGLTSITIPNSVTSIGGGAFSDCSGLTSVSIPNSVTSIGKEAFRGCIGLTSITISNSVTSIEIGAFYGCSGLTSITIPNSVTSIEDWAFQNCSGLTCITIPNSVTSIGWRAFSGCSGLTSVTVQRGTPVAIDVDVFTNRTNATLYVPVGSKALYEAADYWKEFKEIVEVEGMMDASILDNALYADDVTVYPDGATCFPILMKSEESITNIQFDVVLPEGVTIKNSTLTDRKGSDHTITTSSVNGATRFIVTSMGGQVFSDNDGAVINLSLDIDKNLAPGHRGITLRNVTLSTTGAVKVNTPVCTAILSVSDIKSGDADGDGVTDVNDVTSTINHILKKPVANFVRGAADVDGDSVIDVNDVQATIDKALGKTASSRGTDRQEETEPALDPQ